MALQLNLGLFGKTIYLTALQLNQPFTLEEWTTAVQKEHPTWTKKNIKVRTKDMLRQKILSKHYKNFKAYYTCLISKEDFLAANFITNQKNTYNNNPFICGL